MTVVGESEPDEIYVWVSLHFIAIQVGNGEAVL